MSGLRSYARDAAPLAACGDEALTPPSEAEVLALVGEHLVRDGAPMPHAARWTYARWKPATSMTAGFELEYADGERRFVSWKRYADGKATRLEGRRERELAPELRLTGRQWMNVTVVQPRQDRRALQIDTLSFRRAPGLHRIQLANRDDHAIPDCEGLCPSAR